MRAHSEPSIKRTSSGYHFDLALDLSFISYRITFKTERENWDFPCYFFSVAVACTSSFFEGLSGMESAEAVLLLASEMPVSRSFSVECVDIVILAGAALMFGSDASIQSNSCLRLMQGLQSGPSGCEKSFVTYFLICSPSLLGLYGSCSIGPTACGTFMKHSTNPFSQPDAPDWTSPFALIGCYAWGRRSSLEVEVVKVRQTRWLWMRRDKRDLNLISDACRSLGRTHLRRKSVQGFTNGFLFSVHWGLAVRIHHYVSIHSWIH